MALDALIQRQGKLKKAMEGKRSAQRDPEEVTPYHEYEGKEKDEEVPRHF